VDYKLFQGGKIKTFDPTKKRTKFKILRWKHASPAQIDAFAFNSERIQQLRKRYDGWLVAFGYLPEKIIEKMFGKKVEILHEGVRKFFTCSENFAYAAAPPEWAIKELGLRPVKLLPEKYSNHLDDIIPGTLENNMVKEGILEVVPGASYWPSK
jgi:hypothetical protein